MFEIKNPRSKAMISSAISNCWRLINGAAWSKAPGSQSVACGTLSMTGRLSRARSLNQFQRGARLQVRNQLLVALHQWPAGWAELDHWISVSMEQGSVFAINSWLEFDNDLNFLTEERYRSTAFNDAACSTHEFQELNQSLYDHFLKKKNVSFLRSANKVDYHLLRYHSHLWCLPLGD